MSNTVLTVIGFSVIFSATTLGAALVFFFKKDISDKLNAVFLGFAGGIMIAASVWSLLIPSIEGAADYGRLSFLPAAAGFVAGGLFLVLIDKTARFYTGTPDRSLKTFIAITIHNIPEGLAVGFAFGGAAVIGTSEAAFSALGLSIGIAVQNFPEGAAVSLPLKRTSKSNFKSFLFGMGSGAVEPVAAVIGYFLASVLRAVQPWLLSFAAGAMIFVVAEDIIPDSKLIKNPHLSTWGVMLGFVIMMALDVALG